MHPITFALVALGALVGVSGTVGRGADEQKTGPVYSYTMKTIDGASKSLADYHGDVLMIVNVASFCGYTPQYKGLESIYEKYKSRGFRILAFPANNFGSQEPGTNSEIKNFCDKNYHVSFDMFSKISVKGEGQDPLYRYLTHDSPFKGEIGWNFTKFLVDRHGNIAARFPSNVTPTSKEVTEKIEELLAQK